MKAAGFPVFIQQISETVYISITIKHIIQIKEVLLQLKEVLNR